MRNSELKKIIAELAKYETPSGLPAVWRESKFKWKAIGDNFKEWDIYGNPSKENTKVLMLEV